MVVSGEFALETGATITSACVVGQQHKSLFITNQRAERSTHDNGTKTGSFDERA